MVTIPLLVLVTACSNSTVEPASPAAPQVTGTSATPSVTSPTDLLAALGDQVTADQLVSVSPKSTPGHIWAEPYIGDGAVKILQSVAMEGDHVHFEVPGDAGPIGFFGYFVSKSFLIRPAVCPNCGSLDVDYEAGTIKCGSCPATYEAVTGIATNGGPNYPKGWIPNTISYGVITMSLADLQEAFARSLAGESTILAAREALPAGSEYCCGRTA